MERPWRPEQGATAEAPANRVHTAPPAVPRTGTRYRVQPVYYGCGQRAGTGRRAAVRSVRLEKGSQVRALVVRQRPLRTVSVPEELPTFLKLLAEPNRLRILVLLAQGELCVCDIEAGLGLPQNLVSHHLQALKRAGLLRDRREGKWIYYRIEPQTLGERLGALSVVLDTRLAALPATPCAEDESGDDGQP